MDNQNQHSLPGFVSPLSIALLGFMSAALLLAVYHCFVNTFFNPRRSSTPNDIESSVAQLIVGPTKLYGKVCGGESVCAVCLCEFADSEEVRLMPECLHYFHVACIDIWLRSHSSCPMCRAETTAIALPPATVRAATVVGGLTPLGAF